MMGTIQTTTTLMKFEQTYTNTLTSLQNVFKQLQSWKKPLVKIYDIHQNRIRFITLSL